MSTQPSYLTDQFQTFCTTMAHIDFKDVAEAMNAWQGNVKGIDFGSLFPIAHRFCQKRQQCFEAIVEKFEQKGYLPFLPGYSAAPYLPELDLAKRRDTFFLCKDCNSIYFTLLSSTIASWEKEVAQAFPDNRLRESFLAIPIIQEMLRDIAVWCHTKKLSARFVCEVQTEVVELQLVKPEWDSMWRFREMIRSLSLYTNYGDNHWIHRARLIIDAIEEKDELTPDEALERLKAVFGATPWRAVEQLEGLGPEANVNAFLFRLLSGTNVDLSLGALKGVQPSLYF